MKNIAIIIFLLSFGTLLTAQEVSPNKSSFRINLLSPGIGGEFQITPNQTLSANFNLAPQYGLRIPSKESWLKPTHHFGFSPTLSAEYRFYYNRQKRIDKGRSTYNNSGFYLAPSISYSNYPIQISGGLRAKSYSIFKAGGVIGYQKTFKSNFQIGASIGAGLIANSSGISPTVLGKLNFSYIIRPTKRR